MKTGLHISLLLLAVLCQPALLFSQQQFSEEKALTFFMEKAREDALLEQQLQLKYAEDDLDYWKDQRNFEKALKKESYTAYQVYIDGKLEAYTRHEAVCTDQCRHSEHYFQQAHFYSLHANSNIITMAAENATVQSADAKLPKSKN